VSVTASKKTVIVGGVVHHTEAGVAVQGSGGDQQQTVQ